MAAEAPTEPVPEGEANEVYDTYKIWIIEMIFLKKQTSVSCLFQPQASEEEVLPPPCMDLTGFPLKTDIFEGS